MVNPPVPPHFVYPPAPPRKFLIDMGRSKPFGCSVVCITGFQSSDEEAINSQLEAQENKAQGDYLVGLMICTVVMTYQQKVLTVLKERGWEPLTIFYSNQVHDYHPIQVWGKHFDRRTPKRKEKDADAGVSILLKGKNEG